MASLASLLAGVPDPEAQGAVNSSNAMAPVIAPYLADVLSGRAAAQSLPQSTYDPNRSFAQNALDPRGIENAMNMALGFSGGGLGIKAYHGSPYDFNAFDVSKIGTGEGAQAYGHGLYFADNPNVAQTYRDALGKPAVEIGGEKIVPMRGSPEDIALAHLETAHFAQSAAPYSYAARSLRSAYDLAPDTPSGTMRRDIQQAMDVLGRWQEQGAVPANAGKMYEVNINAEPHQFLDWDRHLPQQSGIIPALEQLGLKEPPKTVSRGETFGGWGSRTGSDVYDTVAKRIALQSGTGNLVNHGFDYQGASNALNQAGIPGIRYLDQGSRGAGQGTSNYVVFDASIVDILKKYGLAGLLASGGAVLGQEDK
jgi:hypothetical protein